MARVAGLALAGVGAAEMSCRRRSVPGRCGAPLGRDFFPANTGTQQIEVAPTGGRVHHSNTVMSEDTETRRQAGV